MAILASGQKDIGHKTSAILPRSFLQISSSQNPSWAYRRHTPKYTRSNPSWALPRQTHLPYLRFLSIIIRQNSSCALSLQQTHMPLTHLGPQEVSHDHIWALCKQGHLEKALHLLFTLPSSASPPPDLVYLYLLKVCKKEKALAQAHRIYTHLITHPIKNLNDILGNCLVLTFVACGGIEMAYTVLRRLKSVTSSSWEAVISGYVGCGQGTKALAMYNCMRQAQMEPHISTLVNLLKVCGSIQNLEDGRRLHVDAVERKYDVDVFVGSTLVSMYGKCRSLLEAEFVFCALSQRNVVSWNAMLASYVENGNEERALKLYRQMQEEGVTPNHLTLVAALQACAILSEKKSLETFSWGLDLKPALLGIGQALHADACKRAVASNPFVESTLLSMYRKCGSFMELEAVFSSLSERNVVSWNVMLAAYMEQGHEETTLLLYKTMQEEGVKPDHQTLMVALLACCNLSEKEHAITVGIKATKVMSHKVCQALQYDAWNRGFAFDVILGSMFINIYGKCKTIADAEDTFGQLSSLDVVAWNAMLSAYAEQFKEEKAFKLYRQMHEESVYHDELTLVATLQACGNFAGKEETADYGHCTKVISLEIGKALHSATRKQCLELVAPVANTLISMYGKCGSIGYAEVVFDRLVMRDVVSWNAMLSAYVEQGKFDLALQLYREMRNESLLPDRLTITVVLHACGIAAEKEETFSGGGTSLKGMSLEISRALHSEAIVRGFESNKHLRSRVVSTYAKCGVMFEAENVFVEACEPDTFCWNVMLLAYADHGRGDKALQLYRMMQEHNIVDKRTVVIALKACSSCVRREEAALTGHNTPSLCLELGQCLHADAWKNGLDSNVFVGSTLVSLYGKCGSIDKAIHVFDRMPRKDTVLWNAMLSAYVEHGEGEGTLRLFSLMQKEGARLDQQTLTIALQACCMMAEDEKTVVMDGQPMKVLSLRIGQALHSEAAHSTELSSDVIVVNTLISMYGKCGALREAEKTFDWLFERSTVSCNAMLSAYVEYDHCEKAVQLYQKIRKVLTFIDDITCVYILQASSQTGNVEVCRQAHFIAVSAGIDLSSLLSTTVVHAYGNCGCMADAEAVFHELIKPDVVAWSTCISAFAQQGKSDASFLVFNKMHMEGIMADDVTCSSFLFACSHAGLVIEGVHYFNSMNKAFGVSPTVKHYASLIDLLARTGNLAKVEYMLQRMPMKADWAIWISVLSACCLHGNLELAKFAFTSATRIQPVDSAGHVLMSNIYRQLEVMQCE